MLIGIFCQRSRKNFLRLLRFIMDYLFQEIRDHRCHEFMTKIIGMEKICRNLLCRQSSGRHSGIDAVLHTDAGQIIMSPDLRMIVCSTFTGIIIDIMDQHHCRCARTAINLPHQAFVGLAEMRRTVIVHGKLYKYQIRQPRKQVFLYSRRAELGIGSSDSGVHIIKFRIGKYLFQPAKRPCRITFFRIRSGKSLGNGTADKAYRKPLSFGCTIHKTFQSGQVAPVQDSGFFINDVPRTLAVLIDAVFQSAITFRLVFQSLADPESLFRPVSPGFQIINTTVKFDGNIRIFIPDHGFKHDHNVTDLLRCCFHVIVQ